ncbi:phosphoribosylamine--glycine ligase [Texcoconibacillus texcoconensis]|uniref:Phosphoribosylamine--glycine ligase n=1 Tax=Texcoconibacillus texcoconensis TaxID=1095777 RepID=A0A840QMH3_9BACI|nr:phosphoribosylamine--glycine ligase [Texcoconibacillus texcoconensis]MBB5172556.1 phosphoribosylamine--glycine ligase [Texcoconibacillus texcoconensis]
MNILVVGSGGREHALVESVLKSKRTQQVFVVPGNPGMSDKATCVQIDLDDHEHLVDWAKREEISLAIVGPEKPLMAGLVDRFQEAGIPAFGPTQEAALLEGSKTFAKKLMKKYGISTADYQVFTNVDEAKQYVCENGTPTVIKADGLADGKGVIVAMSEEEALTALDRLMADEQFGESGKTVVIEEFLTGEEVSVMALVNGENVVPLEPAQDHKRAYDHDKGPNTGGMGAYSPVPHLPNDLVSRVEQEVLRPMAKAMGQEGYSFTGVLYAGLMVSSAGDISVIEFNVRFGDPEAQVVLPRLQSDFVDVIEEVLAGREPVLEWSEDACLGVVVASEGYPGSYKKGVPLPRIFNTPERQWYFAGVKNLEGQLLSSGGRILLLSQRAASLLEAQEEVYKTLAQYEWSGMFYRNDIGKRAINNTSFIGK